MPLLKLEDFYPHYRQEVFGGEEIKGIDVYAGRTDEKIGQVCDDVVDLKGRFRYLVIDTSSWGICKKILLPVDSCLLDLPAKRVYARTLLTQKDAEDLPEYVNGITVDYSHEERVIGLDLASTAKPESLPPQPSNPTPDSNISTSGTELSACEFNSQEHQTLKLHEERLIANKSRRESGEVIIGKRIEIDTARLSVSVEKERIVIERKISADANSVASGDTVEFQSGEVARIKLYEESVDIHKEVFVREEVTVKKEVARDTVEVEKHILREELDIRTEGDAIVEKAAGVITET